MVEIPKEFGDYKVEEILGQGGMGVVYKALQKSLDRRVAIKFLPLAYDEELRKRFLLEARMAAKVNHPNIVTIYTFGIANESLPYFVMEYIEGKGLKDIIHENKRIPFQQIVDYAIQMAEALDYAHEQGVIHRDIKPANIMVTKRGHIKIMDFGLAKTKSHFASLTQSGDILGTPYYMSPEQAQGKTDIDERSDIYSLGVVLYEMITGIKPFKGDSSHVVLYKHIYESPLPPSQFVANLHLSLETIVLKCLEKDPSQRFQSAKELLRTLQSLPANLDSPLSFEECPTLGPSSIEKTEIPTILTPEASTPSPKPPSSSKRISPKEVDSYLEDVLGDTQKELHMRPSSSKKTSSSSSRSPSPSKSSPLKPSSTPSQGGIRKKPISRELQELQRSVHRDTIVRKKKNKKTSFFKRFLFLLLFLFSWAGVYFLGVKVFQKGKKQEINDLIKYFHQSLHPPFFIEINKEKIQKEEMDLPFYTEDRKFELSLRTDRKGPCQVFLQWLQKNIPLKEGEHGYWRGILPYPPKPGDYPLKIIYSYQVPSWALAGLWDGKTVYRGELQKTLNLHFKRFLLTFPPEKAAISPESMYIKGFAPKRIHIQVLEKEQKIFENSTDKEGLFFFPLSFSNLGKTKISIHFQNLNNLEDGKSKVERNLWIGINPLHLKIFYEKEKEKVWIQKGQIYLSSPQGRYILAPSSKKG
ncbi:MAG: serine/threonine protein kinase, partial [Planctomycetota bacterium]